MANDPNTIQYVIQEDGFWYIASKDRTPGVPEIMVSSKGVANGLSTEYNDGYDFGPDSYNPSITSGVPLTQTSGIQEACKYLEPTGGTIYLSTGYFYISVPVVYNSTYGLMLSGSGGSVASVGEPSIGTTIVPQSSFPSGKYMLSVFSSPTAIAMGNGAIEKINFNGNGNTVNGLYTANTANLFIAYNNFGFMTNGLFVDRNPNNGNVLLLNNSYESVTGISEELSGMVTSINSQVYTGGTYPFYLHANSGTIALYSPLIQGTSNTTVGIYILNDTVSGQSGGSIFISNPTIGSLSTTSYAFYINAGSSSTVAMSFTVSGGSIDANLLVYIEGSGASVSFPIIKDLMLNNNNVTSIKLVTVGSFTAGILPYLLFANIMTSPSVTLTGDNIPGTSIPTGFIIKNPSPPNFAITVVANPPVSATVYRNNNPYDIRIYLPVYATTAGTAGTVAYGEDSSSTVTEMTARYVNGATSSSAVDIVELVVPAGHYYMFTASGVTFGTATVKAV